MMFNWLIGGLVVSASGVFISSAILLIVEIKASRKRRDEVKNFMSRNGYMEKNHFEKQDKVV